MFCFNCGEQIPENAKFCANCGAQQQSAAAESPVIQAQSVSPQQPVYQPRENWPPAPVKRSSSKTVKWIAVLAIILGALLLVAYFLGDISKSDEQLINERIDAFLEAYNSGDMEGAMENFSAKTRNMYQGVMGMGNALFGGITGFGFNISDMFGVGVGTLSDGDMLTITDRTITMESETKATVVGTLSFNSKYAQMSDRAVITMVKEDGKWYIENMEDK